MLLLQKNEGLGINSFRIISLCYFWKQNGLAWIDLSHTQCNQFVSKYLLTHCDILRIIEFGQKPGMCIYLSISLHMLYFIEILSMCMNKYNTEKNIFVKVTAFFFILAVFFM